MTSAAQPIGEPLSRPRDPPEHSQAGRSVSLRQDDHELSIPTAHHEVARPVVPDDPLDPQLKLLEERRDPLRTVLDL